MARGKKTSDEIKAKVIETKVNAPDKSSRDISNELNGVVSNDTVCDIINDDLPQVATESQRIVELVDRNNRLQSLADKMIEQKIISGEETIKISELVSLRQSTFTQNQLITGKATERHEFTTIDDMQAKLIASRYGSK